MCWTIFGENERFGRMVGANSAVQAHIQLSPCSEVDMEKLVENNDGTGTYSATSAGKVSVSQLLSKMKGLE